MADLVKSLGNDFYYCVLSFSFVFGFLVGSLLFYLWLKDVD